MAVPVTYIGIFVCLLTCVTCVRPQTSCGGGYTHTLGESCYGYVDKAESWPDAQSVCRSLGGFLAEPITTAQNDLMKKLMFESQSSHVWLGGNDLFQEGKWFWATSGLTISLSGNDTDWAKDQPNDLRGQNCLELSSNLGHWNDEDCDETHTFVCQRMITSTVVG